MTKKKTTKQIRAIDRIIKFQIDDGIESLTIGGKEALADLEIDRNSNVTLYVNADKDKINEMKSLVPFINVAVKETGADPDKSKAVTLSQDLTKFALELSEDSKQLAEIIKAETSLTIDFAQLIERLNNLSTAVDKAERNSAQALAKAEKVEREQVEQAKALTGIVTEQTEQGNQLANLDNRITTLENKEQGTGQSKQLYTVINGFMTDSIDNIPNFIIETNIPTNKIIEITIYTNKSVDSALISHGVILENNLKRFTLDIFNGNYNFQGVWVDNNVYTGDVTVFVKIYEIQPVEHYHPNIYKVNMLD